MTTGKSILFKASTISFPKPFHAKTYSTNTAPASNDANHPETAVITGFNEFHNACLKTTTNLFSPFAFAVLHNPLTILLIKNFYLIE